MYFTRNIHQLDFNRTSKQTRPSLAFFLSPFIFSFETSMGSCFLFVYFLIHCSNQFMSCVSQTHYMATLAHLSTSLLFICFNCIVTIFSKLSAGPCDSLLVLCLHFKVHRLLSKDRSNGFSEILFSFFEHKKGNHSSLPQFSEPSPPPSPLLSSSSSSSQVQNAIQLQKKHSFP